MASKSEEKSKKQLEAFKARIDKQKIGEVLDDIFEDYFPSKTPETEKKPSESSPTVFIKNTVISKTTVATEPEKKDIRKTVSKRNTVVRRKTVVEENTVISMNTDILKNIVGFVFEEKLFSEQNFWFNYVVIFHWLLDHLLPQMPFRASQVYLRLFRLAYGIKTNKGMCKVGYASLIKTCGLTRKYISTAVRELEELGAIKILERENKGRQGGGSSYRVLIPEESLKTIINKNTVILKNTEVSRNTVLPKDTVISETPLIYDDDVIKDISSSKEKELHLPSNSIFQKEWLVNFISGFSEGDSARIKRLAERFDHYMLTGGKRKDWINNPTGAFVSLVRGEINVPMPEYAPTFDKRIQEEKEREQERLEREEEELKQQKIESEIHEKMISLTGKEREIFVSKALKRYETGRVHGDEDLTSKVVTNIMIEMDKGEDWRGIWEEIEGSGEE